MKSIIISFLLFLATNGFSQEKSETSSLWGKLALAQNSPNPVHTGEAPTINYKAQDVQNVSIALFDENGKRIHTYEDLYAGTGQIKIRKHLEPGNYTYALIVNGRLVEKKTMKVIEPPASPLKATSQE